MVVTDTIQSSSCLAKVFGMQSPGAIGHQTNEVSHRISTLRVANKMDLVLPVPLPIAKAG